MTLRHPSAFNIMCFTHYPGLRQVPLLPQDHGAVRVLGQGQGGGAQGRDVWLVQKVQGQAA